MTPGFHWTLRPSVKEDDPVLKAFPAELPLLVKQLLLQRGFTGGTETELFLEPRLSHLHGGLFTDLVSPGDHDKVIRRLRLTHPDAFEEDDDSYARRMKEKRRAQARKARMPQPPGKTA